MVMNKAFGSPESLPFDLRMRRVITYEIFEDSIEKAPERKKLEKAIGIALSAIFTNPNLQVIDAATIPVSISAQARIAIENDQSNQETLIRKFMAQLVERLESIAPDFRTQVNDQMIVESIDQTIEIGVEFAQLSEVIAEMNSSKSAMALYKEFENIIIHYNAPNGFSGQFYPWAFDFYKFIGHEFFVMFISFLIREERWEILTNILEEDLYIDNLYGHNEATTTSYIYICSHLESLDCRKQRLNFERISIHSDLLNERHTKGELAEIVPMHQFIDADCLLLLRAELNMSNNYDFPIWVAWSMLHLKKTPKYLVKAYKVKDAQKILSPLGMENIQTFRDKLIEITPKLFRAFGNSHLLMRRLWPLGDFKPQDIGSR